MRWPMLLMAAVLVGCAGATPRPLPVLAVPAAWQTQTVASEAVATDFWDGFGDAQLSALLRKAASANPDLQIAAQHLRLARDARLEAEALKSPSLSFEAGPVDSAVVAVSDARQRNPSIYKLGLEASYELDLWGRIDSLAASTQADALATGFEAEAAGIALAGTVATAYFDLAEADARRLLIERGRGIAEQRLDVQRARLAAGRIDAQALADDQLGLDQLDQQSRDWQRRRRQAVWQLALLCGELPEQFQLAAPVASLLSHAPEVPPGLPSSLLQRRPDVRAAAWRWQAAQARIGVAEAEQFPQIRLTAELGFASDLLHRALSGGVRLFGIGPSISLPLYDGGARAARLDAARSQAEIARLEYRKTGLAAFADVEQALQARAASVELQRYLDGLRRRQAETAQRLEAQVVAGRKSRLDQLDGEEARLDTDNLFLDNARQRIDSLVALHAALGGGWTGSATLPAH